MKDTQELASCHLTFDRFGGLKVVEESSERMVLIMEKRYYIAYGSNLNVRQMMRRGPGGRGLWKAGLTGWGPTFHGRRTGAYTTVG